MVDAGLEHGVGDYRLRLIVPMNVGVGLDFLH